MTTLLVTTVCVCCRAHYSQGDYGRTVLLTDAGCFVGAQGHDSSTGIVVLFAPTDGSSPHYSGPATGTSSWTQVMTLQHPQATPGTSFGKFIAAASGSDVILSGAVVSSVAAFASTSAYRMHFHHAPVAEEHQHFGRAIALSGDVMAAADQAAGPLATLWIFVRVGGAAAGVDAGWIKVNEFNGVDSDVDLTAGTDPAIGTTIVSSNPWEAGGGACWIYTPQGDNAHAGVADADRRWVLSQQLQHEQPSSRLYFCYRMGLDETGQLLAVASLVNDGGDTRVVEVFQRTNPSVASSAWSKTAVLPTAPSQAWFSISISGPIIALGTGQDNVYMYAQQDGGAWAFMQTLSSTQGWFGADVCVHKNVVVVASSSENVHRQSAGGCVGACAALSDMCVLYF